MSRLNTLAMELIRRDWKEASEELKTLANDPKNPFQSTALSELTDKLIPRILDEIEALREQRFTDQIKRETNPPDHHDHR